MTQDQTTTDTAAEVRDAILDLIAARVQLLDAATADAVLSIAVEVATSRLAAKDTEIERLRAENSRLTREQDADWALRRVRAALRTPEGRAVSIWAGEVVAELDRLRGELAIDAADTLSPASNAAQSGDKPGTKRHPTLAETRTGTDWCPRCEVEVGTSRYTQESSTLERCALCSAVLVPIPAPSEEPGETHRG